MGALLGLCLACGAKPNPAPPQPVPFSHKVHAGANQIGCTLCHAYAWHSRIAGIPSAARCYGCHRFVSPDKPNVKVVNDAFLQKQPLVWNQVYRLPDHVYFTHERHLKAGLDCVNCHGQVAQMNVMHQVTPLTMGWCLDCHRARHAPTECVTCHK